MQPRLSKIPQSQKSSIILKQSKKLNSNRSNKAGKNIHIQQIQAQIERSMTEHSLSDPLALEL